MTQWPIYRAGADDDINADGRVLSGFAARFDRVYDLGPWTERVHRSAFNKTIQEQDVGALFNHDANQVLGRMSNGTLRLNATSTGLRYEIDLPETALGDEIRALVDRGDLGGSSFAGRVMESSFDESQDPPVETLRQVSLRDVGPVMFPAYDGTTPQLRAERLEVLSRDLGVPLDVITRAANEGGLSDILGGKPPADRTPAPAPGRRKFDHLAR